MTQDEVDDVTRDGFRLARIERFTTRAGNPALRYWFKKTGEEMNRNA